MMSEFAPHDVPVMASGFRLQWEDAQDSYVILYPEGMVKLNLAAGEILSRCDGKRTVAELIDELQRNFPDAEDLATDVSTFLSTAHEQRWIRHRPT